MYAMATCLLGWVGSIQITARLPAASASRTAPMSRSKAGFQSTRFAPRVTSTLAPHAQVRPDREQRQLEAIPEAKFQEDAGQVALDRLFGNAQPHGDVPILQPLADEARDVPLARGQELEPI